MSRYRWSEVWLSAGSRLFIKSENRSGLQLKADKFSVIKFTEHNLQNSTKSTNQNQVMFVNQRYHNNMCTKIRGSKHVFQVLYPERKRLKTTEKIIYTHKKNKFFSQFKNKLCSDLCSSVFINWWNSEKYIIHVRKVPSCSKKTNSSHSFFYNSLATFVFKLSQQISCFFLFVKLCIHNIVFIKIRIFVLTFNSLYL